MVLLQFLVLFMDPIIIFQLSLDLSIVLSVKKFQFQQYKRVVWIFNFHPITQNMWAPRLRSVFGIVSSFCFHHSII